MAKSLKNQQRTHSKARARVSPTTAALIAELNKVRGLKYPDVGYTYFADITGDGSYRRECWVIINPEGGVSRSHLNHSAPRKRCALIRAEIVRSKRRTITLSQLKRLAFCNSEELPKRVVHKGVVKEWVGIGWIALKSEKPKPNDVYVVEETK